MKNICCGLVLMMALSLTGCINISTRFQPDDLTVKDVLRGSDCVPIIFNLGFGTADIDAAKLKGRKRPPLGASDNPFDYSPMTRVRRVELSDTMFLFFGEKCVDVVGEP